MSTLLADQPACARSAPTVSRWLVLALPALGALAYAFLLAGLAWLVRAFHVTAPPGPGATFLVVLAILAAASAVMALAFGRALALGRQEGGSLPGRLVAHLAFAAPSLLVGFGNVAGLFHAHGAVLVAWPLFWLALMAVAFLADEMPSRVLAAGAGKRLAVAHGVSALLILVLFILPHLGNHLAGILSAADHIGVMKVARLLYRSAFVEPLLLTLIAFQLMSGAVLVRRRLMAASDLFGTLQTVTGVYAGIYLLAHMTAAFAARGAAIDTNWNWLTYDDRGLLSHLDSFTLVAYYWLRPIAIMPMWPAACAW